MSIRIGRFTAPRTDSASLSGRELSVSGSFQATNAAAALAARQRIAGYVNNPDEPIVPVTWDQDPTVDGFYRVLDTDVTLDNQRSFTTNAGFHYRWSANLEQIEGYAAPRIENTVQGTYRSNSHGFNTNSEIIAYHAVPAGATAYEILNYDGIGGSIGPTTLDTADGFDVEKYQNTIGTSFAPYKDIQVGWMCDPALYYGGSCSVSVSGEKTVGRQIVNDATAVELSNELARLSVSSNGITCGWWTSNGWKSVIFVVGNNTDGVWSTNTPPTGAVSVLRNAPEQSSVRFITPEGFYAALDVTLRRGSRYFECLWVQRSAGKIGVSRFTNEAVSPAGAPGGGSFSGVKASNGNADGIQWALATPQDHLRTSNVGRIFLTTNAQSTVFPFMIGADMVSPDGQLDQGADNLAAAYMITGGDVQAVQPR